MEYAMRHLYFPPKGSCVYQENTSDKWHVPQYPTKKHCITSIYYIKFWGNLVNLCKCSEIFRNDFQM